MSAEPTSRWAGFVVLLVAALAALSGPTSASAGAPVEAAVQRCITERVLHGAEDATAGQIREACIASEDAPSRGRGEGEGEESRAAASEVATAPAPEDARRGAKLPFGLTPRHRNFLLGSYNADTSAVNLGDIGVLPDEIDKTELKFQFSVKFPLYHDVLFNEDVFYFAYTNRAWWQAFNDSNSRPFREINHEPEIIYSLPGLFELGGVRNTRVDLAVNHQSNGRAFSISRSWNRLIAELHFEKGPVRVVVRPWWNFSWDDDLNDDINQYMGFGEISASYRVGSHELSLMSRNNISSDGKGTLVFDWSFPLTSRFRGLLQYYRGHGESLIDYNQHVERLSLGLEFRPP